MRGSYAPVTWPNVEPMPWALLSRLLNSVWLRTLNASTRSSSVIRSRKSGVVFVTDKSRFVRPGLRSTLRGEVPYPEGTTLLKDALVMWQGTRALLACVTGSSVVSVISLINRSEKIVDDKIRYLTAQTSAAGKVGAEMHAGENTA